jgi:hypothetical protein
MVLWQRAVWTALVWLWLPVLIGLVWLMMHTLFPGYAGDRVIALWVQRWFFPHGVPTGLGGLPGWLWFWVAVNLAISAMIVGSQYGMPVWQGWLTGVLAVSVAVVLFGPFLTAVWDNDKDLGRFYDTAAVVHVPSLSDPPAAVTSLLAGSRPGRDGCVRMGRHDVPACIKVDNGYAAMRWESRTSGLASARTAMTQAAAQTSGVDVMGASMTYVWGDRPNTGQWSAILDGSGDKQPVYGVAEWDGETNATTVCRFTGDHRIDRAFNGTGRNDLRHLLAEKYPKLFFAAQDVHGYCLGGRPVIAIAMQRQIGYKNRTVQVPAGDLVLRGTPDGSPDFTYMKNVKPGDLPLSAYPLGLTRAQRDATTWLAGRGNKQSSFGFQTSTFATQKDNPGEYVLRGADHRLYYVTPLTPRGTQSQAFVAYGIVAADEVHDGKLNTYDLYVLATGDPMIANLASLNAKSSLIAAQNGAELEGFIPQGGDRWRVYGVRNGQTVFYINLSASDQLQPETVMAGTGGELPAQPAPAPTPSPTPQPTATTDCGKPPAQLDNKQLAHCRADLGDELRRRNGG